MNNEDIIDEDKIVAQEKEDQRMTDFYENFNDQ